MHHWPPIWSFVAAGQERRRRCLILGVSRYARSWFDSSQLWTHLNPLVSVLALVPLEILPMWG